MCVYRSSCLTLTLLVTLLTLTSARPSTADDGTVVGHSVCRDFSSVIDVNGFGESGWITGEKVPGPIADQKALDGCQDNLQAKTDQARAYLRAACESVGGAYDEFMGLPGRKCQLKQCKHQFYEPMSESDIFVLDFLFQDGQVIKKEKRTIPVTSSTIPDWSGEQVLCSARGTTTFAYSCTCPLEMD